MEHVGLLYSPPRHPSTSKAKSSQNPVAEVLQAQQLHSEARQPILVNAVLYRFNHEEFEYTSL